MNRVGDDFRDQLLETGVAERPDDLDRIAALGAQRLRFPLLWERIAPEAPGRRDWRWSDARIERLRELGVAPIAGLVHHGSGPRYTDLLDPGFATGLAAHAQAVAERYPDIDAWTPVNEPVTTARFAGLYGLWYPHGRDDRTFVRALLNELRGTVLAMRAIRRVNPAAQLVQTEDLGRIESTPRLAYQARFENERRWLSFDLLLGRVLPGHRLWRWLLTHGASEAELRAFAEEPCPPDILGINHYVTSDRFLDDRLHLHPPERHGGNGRHRYVDIETVRVHGEPLGGFAARLGEAHARYDRPLAITEAHLNCTREEQLRWLRDAWRGAEAARDAGADVRAVTVWSVFGAVDWHTLLTRREGRYEPGLFDARTTPPRPTALARLARELAGGARTHHPASEGPGWWEREVRIACTPHGPVRSRAVEGRPLLVTGATGTLGRAFARLCALRGLPCQLVTRAEMDIADPASVAAALERWQPWALVNTAGYVRVDDAENDPRQWRENAIGPAVLARACAGAGVRLLGFSSDLVFDGEASTPYRESATPRPLNAYGRAKLEAEQRMLADLPQALVVRTAAFFGPWDRHNFVTQALAALRRGERWHAAADQWVSPTYVPDLVHTALDLLIDGESGLWHLANRGAVSWAELARQAAEVAGLDAGLVLAVPGAQLGQRAPRPRYAALGSERGAGLPLLAESLARYLGELDPASFDEAQPLRAA